MTPITVKRAMQLKDEAEQAIVHILQKFETDTGLTVQRVDIDTVGSTENQERIGDVHIISSLEFNSPKTPPSLN